MKNCLCIAPMGVTCVYKKNIKPHVACGAAVACTFQEHLTAEEHGTKLMKLTEGF